ncbi:MAG: ARMT1-like domain-containing protein [Planctomycetota bacterium]|nr:ARMT1-like domain-containing protein [Planctomycetota bacterium]
MSRFVPQCYPCALRRALCTAERISDDDWLQQKVVDESMRILRQAETGQSPAEMVGGLLKSVHSVLGSADPWREVRERWLAEMQEALPGMRQQAAQDSDPLGRALLISARCNVFANEILQSKAIREDLRRLGMRAGDPMDGEFVHDERKALDRALSGASRLLFLHDTAPELPADLVLLEQLKQARSGLHITSVVRESPMLLKACQEDADRVELVGDQRADDLFTVGGDGLGLMLDEVGESLRKRLDQADLILAKGSSHQQTLAASGLPVFFLVRAKCPVTAAAQSCRIGELLLIRSD